MIFFQYDTIATQAIDLKEILNAKAKEGWGIDSWKLVDSQLGVFVILRKEITRAEMIGILRNDMRKLDSKDPRYGRLKSFYDKLIDEEYPLIKITPDK